MDIPASILQILRHNEIVAKRFHRIETSILSILNFKDFFERLLTTIGETLEVPYVWITIIEESAIARQLKEMDDSELVMARTCFVSRNTFFSLTNHRVKPLLANRQLDRFRTILPDQPLWGIGSIAVAPISLDGVIVGSINQADTTTSRFHPGMDTELLEGLALKISLCLSNVTAHERIKYMAFHDPLTGLLNRRVMEKILEREFQRSLRYRSDLAVVFLDLDKFKAINDRFGHDQGDAALIHVAEALVANKRTMDVAVRFAGDEFVVILPETDQFKALQYIDRVMRYLDRHPVMADQNSFHVSLSSGVASALEEGISSFKALLKRADDRLYGAKKKKQERVLPS
ncbi:MAG: sensor domain-containing diguanylate cyclase [Desulfobacterium sp.]|nr:sensor domain-containing diguanylate cyclase [Desulfobacterium sp.]